MKPRFRFIKHAFKLTLLTFSLTASAVDIPLTQYVNPLIGTEMASDAPWEAANTTPAALVPFGMVQLGPDTTTSAGGYRYNHSTINAFSMNRFSGRAVSCWLDVGLMPTTGFSSAQPSPGTNWATYTQGFTHGSPNEVIQPGFYHVHLDTNNIDVDLTATARTGFAKFTFPSGTSSNLLINAGHSANGAVATGTQIASVDTANKMITGSAQSTGCGSSSFSYQVFFAIQYDRAATGYGTWNGATNTANSTASGLGSQTGAWLTFDTTSNHVVQAKIGISFVSIANAQDNLTRENPNNFASPYDFNTIKANADAAWNSRLNQIQVTGGTTDQKTAFYTALYHTHIHPNIFSDGNGQYIGFDGVTHTLAAGRVQYENFASWDQHRTQMPFLAIFAPNEAEDMIDSLANFVKSDNSGTVTCLPRWSQANGDTRTMNGDGSTISVANVYAYGVTNYDTATLKQAMINGANDPTAVSDGHICRANLSTYISSGYVKNAPADTLEYAAADYALARFSKMLGDQTTAATYLDRAQSWKNQWNAAQTSPTGYSYTGYIMPRNSDGTWVSQSVSTNTQFKEGNGAQYTWMIPFNRASLIDLMGGKTTALQRLSDHFGTTKANLNGGDTKFTAFMGNEQSSLHPSGFAYMGAPAKGAEVWRRLFQTWYVDPISGVRPSVAAPGNDDGGSLSSTQVLSAIGLNHAVHGVAGFIVGSPVFDTVVMRLKGGTLTLNTTNNSTSNIYVQGMNLNGVAYNSAWLPWSTVKSGGTIDITMGSSSTSSWGTDTRLNPPPSFDGDYASSGAIFYEAESLTVAGMSAGDTQSVATDNMYSNGSAVLFKGNAVGDYISFTVNVPEARTYDIRIGVKNDTTRGTWQFDSNGVNHGGVMDMYSPASNFTEIDVGTAAFGSTGNKTFKFTATGKNASSTQYWMGLDYIKLIPQ